VRDRTRARGRERERATDRQTESEREREREEDRERENGGRADADQLPVRRNRVIADGLDRRAAEIRAQVLKRRQAVPLVDLVVRGIKQHRHGSQPPVCVLVCLIGRADAGKLVCPTWNRKQTDANWTED